MKHDDGLIYGSLDIRKLFCEVCEHEANCIIIEDNRLRSRKINDQKTLIVNSYREPIKYLGVTCGCYAKFHRQVAHIEDKMKGRT